MPTPPKRSQREYLSRDDIEKRAAKMQITVLGSKFNPTKPAPLKKLIQIFESENWLKFDDGVDLSQALGSGRALGCFSVNPNTILLDKTLKDWPERYNYTLAHEIGHFCLHRKMIGPGKQISREQLPPDEEKSILYGEKSTQSDLEWVEWQADEFALALLLPRYALFKKIAGLQKDLGILNNNGIIYLDDSPTNKMYFKMIVSTLTAQYASKREDIIKRLRHTKLLKDHRGEASEYQTCKEAYYNRLYNIVE